MAINPDSISTIRVDQLPNASIASDSIVPHSIGEILYKGSINDLVEFIRPLVSNFQYEIKDLWVDETYVSNNFESTGIGKNLCIGWAICDGRNGTPAASGTVNVGRGLGTFGTDYLLKDSGGDPNHTLTVSEMPSHNHSVSQIRTYNASFGTAGFYDRSNGAESNGIVTDYAGEGYPHNNMQPYLVYLRIMKL